MSGRFGRSFFIKISLYELHAHASLATLGRFNLAIQFTAEATAFAALREKILKYSLLPMHSPLSYPL